MQRVLVVVVLGLSFFACAREHAKADAPRFNDRQFFTFVLLTTRADAELAATASKRGRHPETRLLGDTLHHQQQQMYDALAALAQKRHVAVPQGIEERKVALKDNLATLPGQVFDRGYNLAMLQDLRRLRTSLQGAAASNDAELAAYAQQFLPGVQQLEERAGKALEAAGGSPFTFE